jgi:hemerythrin-like metal-binding protein
MLDLKLSPSMKIGNPDIDNDHMYLLCLMNTIAAATKCHVHPNVLEKLADLVIIYTSIHFAREQQIQKQFGYEETEEHKALHNNFIERVRSMKTTLSSIDHSDNDYKKSMAKFNELMKYWWTEHILEEDVKMKKYFQINASNKTTLCQ